MPNEITGIQKGAIIRAQDVYNRYHDIIDSLLQKAHSNAAELSSRISTFKNSLTNDDSRAAWDALEASSYTEVSATISNIIANLKNLETQWHGEDNSNSAHGGIQEYEDSYTDHQSRILNPLHVIKNNRTDEYAADGRVNQSDFIGAYHFKSTIESLYAIATSLRDIYVKFSDSSTTTDINVTKIPFSDIALTRPSVVDNYIGISSISVDSESPLSVHIVPFHDWILNTNANGSKMGVFDEISVYEHGWTSSSADPHRYPDALANEINSQYLINKNPNGRQIVRNLTSTTKGEQSKLSNFYSNNMQYGFGQYPSAGISKEFYSMKYGTDTSGKAGNIEISITSTPSIDLNDYFYKDIQEYRDLEISDIIHDNVIRSKTLGNNHIVYAQTVNDMFKRLNIMLVQISSSLYGRYVYRNENGHIVNYSSGNPLGGLAYPEMLSWYSGGTDGGIINFLNRENPIGGQPVNTETYNGSLRNDSFVANESDDTWQSIKCGYPWIKNNTITSMAEIYRQHKGSAVPMSFNAGVVNPDGTSNFVKVSNLTNRAYGYGTSEGGTYTIKASKQNSPNLQVFTRYCISHPVELSVEQRITGDASISGKPPIYPSSDPSISSFKNLDINSKYLFMPYMTYLDSWYSTSANVYVGNFLDQEENIAKSSNNFESIGMPVQMKNRNQIWNSDEIVSDYDDINVELILKKPDTENSFYFVDNTFNLDIIEYIIKGIITVNEVNHTHPGSSRLNLSVENTSVFDMTLTYNEVTNVTGTVSNTVRDVTSTVYFGKNDYVKQNDRNLSSFYKDALDAIMYDRYKFNDFYYDYEPLRFVDTINAVAPYFSCGGNNLYLGGNWTAFWNWNIKKHLSTGSRQFQLYPYFNNDGPGSDGKNMIQGNFYFSANHSNQILCSYTIPASSSSPIQQTVDLGYCEYTYVPVPNPVSIDVVDIDVHETENNIKVHGWCGAWWNNLERVQIKMDAYTKDSSEPSKLLFNAKLVPDEDYNSDYPEHTDNSNTNKRSFNASRVLSSSTLTGTNISATSNWNDDQSLFEFDISCSCNKFPENISALNVSYVFSNEDGGKREFLNKPYAI